MATQADWKSHVMYLMGQSKVTTPETDALARIISDRIALSHGPIGYTSYLAGYNLAPVQLYSAYYEARNRVIIGPSLYTDWTDLDYYTYLHELGHAQQRIEDIANPDKAMWCESDAWLWAMRQAREWNVMGHAMLKVCMRSHTYTVGLTNLLASHKLVVDTLQESVKILTRQGFGTQK